MSVELLQPETIQVAEAAFQSAFFGIVAMYTVKGSIKLHEPLSGVKIKRFGVFSRFTHWVMAFSFLALAITGLLILYGKYFYAESVHY